MLQIAPFKNIFLGGIPPKPLASQKVGPPPLANPAYAHGLDNVVLLDVQF